MSEANESSVYQRIFELRNEQARRKTRADQQPAKLLAQIGAAIQEGFQVPHALEGMIYDRVKKLYYIPLVIGGQGGVIELYFSTTFDREKSSVQCVFEGLDIASELNVDALDRIAPADLAALVNALGHTLVQRLEADLN